MLTADPVLARCPTQAVVLCLRSLSPSVVSSYDARVFGSDVRPFRIGKEIPDMSTETKTPSSNFLTELSDSIRTTFEEKRSLMSFDEYFEAFQAEPQLHSRSIAQYVRDMFDYFGEDVVDIGVRKQRRFRLFDMDFLGGKNRLVGHEEAQNEIYRILNNFIRERRITRLVLLHGPNGSAKSSLINCIVRGLEHYSRLDEGPLYRFNWVFPTDKLIRTAIGFGNEGEKASREPRLESYAHLDELQLDAKLLEELRDNPLLLIPPKQRQEHLLKIFGKESREIKAKGGKADFTLSDYIFEGDLSHKSRLIYNALLTSYRGDFREVLKHVQVERFYISKSYRQSAVTVEPQLRVDAGSRQVTADRSLQALPIALQNQTLFEPMGDLVDGNRGITEFNDLLKRHPDLNKYLIGTVEKGTVPVEHAILAIDSFLIGSANENFLEAFKGQPEYASFKGRLDLVRMPYILNYVTEQRIYDQMLEATELPIHVAPRTTYVASLWSVLTRLMPPDAKLYPELVRDVMTSLSPLEKAELYTHGKVPDGLTGEQAREMRALVEDIHAEYQSSLEYEGLYGMSPRETKSLIFRAVQRTEYACLSPQSVFEELRELVKDASIHPFLRIKSDGQYHSPAEFIDVVKQKYLDLVDGDVRSSMGLVEEASYERYFSRYVSMVSHQMKGERILNPVTGKTEEVSESFMHEMEKKLGINTDNVRFRDEVISAVAAFRIDNPEADLKYSEIFPELFIAIEQSYFNERKTVVKRIERNLLLFLHDGRDALAKDDLTQVETTLSNMETAFGYCKECAKDTIIYLLRERYSESEQASH